MSNRVVLLAEPDRAFRGLMGRTLTAAGYFVSESSNELQLEAELRVQPLLGAKDALLVLGAQLAARCAPAIAEAARERVRRGFPQARVILTCEFGTAAALRRPELAPCIWTGILEKPFDLHELHAMALDCLLSPPGVVSV